MTTAIKVPVTGDVSDLDRAMDRAESSMEAAARTANRSADRIDSSFASAADGADTMASKSSQAAGALGDLGGVVADGLGFPGLGAAMENAGMWAQGLAGAGDALNLITESTIVKNITAKAATLAKAAADRVAAGAARVMAAGQWALNAAMSANPIGLVIVAVVALVAALVIAYKKSETFRNIVNAAFSMVKRYVTTYINGVKTVITTAWNIITNVIPGGVTKIANAIGGLPGRLKALAGRFLEAGKALMKKIFDGFATVGSIGADIGRNLFDGIRKGINAAIRGINKFLPNSIGVGPVKIDLPDNPIPEIPALANGGIVTGPTLALIGEAGAEAVIPLDRLGALGAARVSLTVVAPVGASSADIGRELSRHLDAYFAIGGRRRA